MADSVSVTMKLGNGNKSDGTPKYESVNLGALNAAAYDDAKAKAIIQPLKSLLSLTVHHAEKTERSTMAV